MRYFPVLAWAGCLQQRGAATAGMWDPSSIRFEDDATVTRILALMPSALMTLDVYSHAIPALQEQAVRGLAADLMVGPDSK